MVRTRRVAIARFPLYTYVTRHKIFFVFTIFASTQLNFSTTRCRVATHTFGNAVHRHIFYFHLCLYVCLYWKPMFTHSALYLFTFTSFYIVYFSYICFSHYVNKYLSMSERNIFNFSISRHMFMAVFRTQKERLLFIVRIMEI